MWTWIRNEFFHISFFSCVPLILLEKRKFRSGLWWECEGNYIPWHNLNWSIVYSTSFSLHSFIFSLCTYIVKSESTKKNLILIHQITPNERCGKNLFFFSVIVGALWLIHKNCIVYETWIFWQRLTHTHGDCPENEKQVPGECAYAASDAFYGMN